MPHVNKNFARLEKIFSHINFSLSQKQRYEQNSLSFRSALHFCSATKSLKIFWRVSFPASKITPIKLIKKKDFYNTPLRVVKRQRPNTIQVLWIVKNQEHRNIAWLSLQLRSYRKKTHTFTIIAMNCVQLINFVAVQLNKRSDLYATTTTQYNLPKLTRL